MFRLLKLKPPHGWNAVAWELAIVTLGVIIALAAQQWAGGLDWSGKVRATRKAVRAELQEHYGWAVEYRVVYPCLAVQISQLKDRVLASGSTINPAPLFEEGGAHYVVRLPSKDYTTDAWDAAVSDGTIRSFEPALRRQLAGHYIQLLQLREIIWENNAAEPSFVALTHPLPLDPAVRYEIIKDLERMRGRLEYLDDLNGQLIEYIQKAGMIPPPETARVVTERYGTYKFCKAHGMPMRPFKDAMQAVPN
jgi:hypothetical protein